MYDFLAGTEVLRQVADAGADLEDDRADEGPHSVGHPRVEPGRLRQRVENPRPFVQVNVPPGAIAENQPDRLKGVFERRFFALGVGAAVIADGDLVEGGAALCELDRQLRLQAEAVAAQRDDLTSDSRKAL